MNISNRKLAAIGLAAASFPAGLGCDRQTPAATPTPTSEIALETAPEIAPMTAQAAAASANRDSTAANQRPSAPPPPIADSESTGRKAPKGDANDTAAGNENDGGAEGDAFNPPFPNRRDFFTPPTFSPTASAGSDDRRQGVALRGFVTFGGERVIVQIAGEVCVLAVGESRRDVKVISITPPDATFARHGERWVVRLSPTQASP